MPPLSLIFSQCRPRPEILAGELPDAIFATDLWDFITGKAHDDYRDPVRFFSGTHPTENLKLLVKDVTERLAGVEGSTPVFRLETGFGGGKTHGLIATVHASRFGEQLAGLLGSYKIDRFPRAEEVRVAAFVGEESGPLAGNEHLIDGQRIKTYTPWGQIALFAGGLAGYELIEENDLQGITPARGALEQALGNKAVLILLDELVLYMARGFALPEDHPRHKVNSQWPTFFQTLFSIASRRPRTSVIVTLPSEQDANRRLTGELKQYVPTILETVDELEQTASRHARNLTPTQTFERAAVLGRRLFESVDASCAADIAKAYTAYYEEQRSGGVQIDGKAFEAGYAEQIRASYPFHPEFVRLFAERLADIPEFQATRGALRLVGRTIRGVWAKRNDLRDAFLLHPCHVDLSRSDVRDEILARLGHSAFERGLEADVIRPEGGTHANQVETGWPWHAASEASLIVFLHSLPDGSRGMTPPEAALAVGRPGRDLAYIARGMEETERRAWYMRREGDHYLFRTRASVNKRFQERLSEIQPGEIRETLDSWIQEVYSGFSAFQIVPFPQDHTAISDTPDRLRLAVIHYDKECGVVGGGDRLNFVKTLFIKTGVNESPRRYRNNMVFLLAECTRIAGLKDAVRALIAWERVRGDIEAEQTNLAQAGGSEYRVLKDLARRGATGVPAEFMALENDLGEVLEKLGTQELNVRSKLLEAYRVLAFPRGAPVGQITFFDSPTSGPVLECYRVDLGERPEAGASGRGRRNVRQAVAEGPILQSLRDNNKLVPEASIDDPLVLAPQVLRRAPLWKDSERKLSTEEVWDRLRRESELPMILKPADLLPTFRAGLTAEPEALWTYYNQSDKKVFVKDNAPALSPVISSSHFLYDVREAIPDRIIPLAVVAPQEVWDHLWPREGTDRAPTTTTMQLLEQAKSSNHFPVLPERSILWQAFQEGVRENRWVLYMPGPSLAIGSQELAEWPGTPLFDQHTELWTYQAALDRGIYPHQQPTGGGSPEPVTPYELQLRCWPVGADQVPTEAIERSARNVWADLSRSRLEALLLDGLRAGKWAIWKKGPDETFFTAEDRLFPVVRIGTLWHLVDPTSSLTGDLEGLRPGRGPQPVKHAGTPREVFIRIWEELGIFPGVRIAEMTLIATDRNTLDNTLVATWADRPVNAQSHVSLQAAGQREVQGKREVVDLRFEGRFNETRNMLSPIWPFERQGELDVTVTVQLAFDPPVGMGDNSLERYRTALMDANQGTVEVNVVPFRFRGPRGA